MTTPAVASDAHSVVRIASETFILSSSVVGVRGEGVLNKKRRLLKIAAFAFTRIGPGSLTGFPNSSLFLISRFLVCLVPFDFQNPPSLRMIVDLLLLRTSS